MKNKYYILILIIFLSINSLYAADYYPELGIDPFYSSLNPTYINQDETQVNESTLINLFKKKTFFKKKKVEVKEENKETDNSLNIEQDNEIKNEQLTEIKNDKNPDLQTLNNEIRKETKDKNIVDVHQETFVSPQKKSLTKIELEKELRKEEREKEKQKRAIEKQNQKSLKEKLSFFKNKKTEQKEQEIIKEPDMEFSADYMEYYPDRYELEAIGNAKVNFKAQNTILTANKIVFNYDRNILKATENVFLISNDSQTEGDFIRLDLNKPNGWIENPVTTTPDIKISAKEAFVYSDKIEEYDGVAKILKDEVISFGARSFAAYVDQSNLFTQKQNKLSDSSKGIYKLKASTIEIDAQQDHEIITVKNADLYMKNRKIAAIPSFKIVTNKQHASVETNLPEFGSQSMLGMHIGPAVVLNVPGGSTLKLAPILTYSKDKLGIGGIARFRNQSNMTEIAYGSSRDQFVIRGKQKLAPGLALDYSRFTNQNEWFLGYRMPKYSTQLTYSRSDYVKDLKLHFSQLYSAGLFVDNLPNKDLSDIEGRLRWMTQTYKPLFKYTNEEGDVGINAGLIAQTAATTYTTGDTTGIVRFGPSLSTKVGPWNQSFMYYQTAIAGQSPFEFDRYRYGRSNVVLIESIKVCKYLTVGYLASLALNRDNRNDDLFQENRVLVSIGPEYAKLTIGYDSIRRNTMFVLSMLVGTQDSDISFKKSVIKNPEKIGKEKKEQKTHKKKSYKKYLKEAPKPEDFH